MGHLQLTRTPVLNEEDLESVVQGAIRILGEVGIEVAHPQLAARARERGFRLQDGRVRLSRREVEVVRLVADGLTNREIGQKLYLSHRTVSSHLYRVFPKLGITSRAQLSMHL